MAEAYDLTRMLEEIVQDEKVSTATKKKISQSDIQKMLLERQKRAGRPKGAARLRLGEMLREKEAITTAQLDEAIDHQARKGGKIGSILVELGHLSLVDLLEALSKQAGIPAVDLFQIKVDEHAIGLVPTSIMEKHRVLPIAVEERSVRLAMENPADSVAVHQVEFLTGQRVEPVVVPSYQMELAFQSILKRGARSFSGAEIQQTLMGPVPIHALLEQLMASRGSDMLISDGVPPTIKQHGVLNRTGLPPLTADQCVAYAKALMTERQWELFLERKELDFGVDFANVGRFRVNGYRQKNSVSLAIRRINDVPSRFEDLGLPGWLEEIIVRPQGLILVTAPTGHGKSTTITAMLNYINNHRKCNVITLEDPIEFLHTPRECNINQREIGTDTDSFAEGMLRIFRQAPDVIMIGELRDNDTFETAIKAAGSGHLVFSTMHANNATAAVETMINRFPSHLQAQVRQQVADALLLIFSQRLIPGKQPGRTVLAYEKLVNSFRMKNFIRENKVHQIRTQISAESEDFASIDLCILKLLKEDKITQAHALLYADNQEFVMKMSGQRPGDAKGGGEHAGRS
jgi:twitching motility protein PilT